MFNKSSKLVCFLIFVMFVINMTGCRYGGYRSVWDRKYYEYQPTFNDRAVARTIASEKIEKDPDVHSKKDERVFDVNGMTVEVRVGYVYFPKFKVSIPLGEIAVSDADVIGFSNDLQKIFRHRMNKARRVRLGSGTLQILAASAGAAVGLTSGDVAVAGGFAMLAAVIPELQNIFQARGRVAAYTDGLELIQDASARYYKNRIKEENGEIQSVSTKTLTKEGSVLLEQTVACIKLVDKALLTNIPTIEDLEAATGRIRDKFALKAVPRNISIPTEGDVIISIINGFVIGAASDNANVVKIVEEQPSLSNPLNEIKLKGGVVDGKTKVRLFNNRGAEEVVEVKVGAGSGSDDDGTAVGTNKAAINVSESSAGKEINLSFKKLDYLDPNDRNNNTFGILTFMGGIRINSEELNSKSHFGGLSGLAFLPQDKEANQSSHDILAISDKGYWFKATLQEDNDGKLIGLEHCIYTEMLDTEGNIDLAEDKMNAESIAISPEGKIVVSFEGTGSKGSSNRLWSYTYDNNKGSFSKASKYFTIPSEEWKFNSNKGIEAVAFDNNRLVMISETDRSVPEDDNKSYFPGWVLEEKEAIGEILILKEKDLRPTGLTGNSDGELIIMEHGVHEETDESGKRKNSVKISTLTVSAENVGSATIFDKNVLNEFSEVSYLDNFEGITSRVDDGSTVIYIISDNNFEDSNVQENLLLKFKID